VKKINVYLNDKEPWKVKDEKEFHAIMYTALDNLANVNALLKPYIPGVAEKVEKQLGVVVNLDNFYSAKIFKLTDADALFPRIEWEEKVILPLNLKVAKVVSAEPHPDADKLLVLKVDFGEERQVVAGLKDHYKPEELIGKKLVVVTNLEPAKLRGVESQAMLLAGVKGDDVKIITSELKEGAQISIEGAEVNEDQISFDDFKKLKLKIKNHEVFLSGKKLEEINCEIESGKVY